MTEGFYVVLEVAILPGQLEKFQDLARDLITSARSEPGTLNYEWNLSADKTVCHVYERYQSSAAFLTHAGSFGPFAERFTQSCRATRLHVYGTPSEEAKAALDDLNPVYFSPLGGFSR